MNSQPVTPCLEALTQGELNQAVSLQEQIVEQNSDLAEARFFLFELKFLQGELREALMQLRAINSDAKDWPKTDRYYAKMLKAEQRRSHRQLMPDFLSPAPKHARWLRRAYHALRLNDAVKAQRAIEVVETSAPHFFGHVDGREFADLRDTDDRFATVIEAFVGSHYVWLPMDQIKKLRLDPVKGYLDHAYRPAQLNLVDGTAIRVVLPLLYPRAHELHGQLALGQDSDWYENEYGIMMGQGARVLIVGDEELRLGDIQQLDLRSESAH